jgi:CDP-glucose 4,6-dehydratase
MATQGSAAASGEWQPSSAFWTDRAVAVTGGTGFLGSHVLAALHAAGAHTVALVRDDVPPSPISADVRASTTFVRGDITDQALLERLVSDYEVRTVLHLAAQSQVGVANRSPVPTLDANVRGTWCVLEAARRSPLLEQVVVASSDKAYGRQPVLPYTEEMPLLARSPYDVSKACAEMIAQSFHLTFDVPLVVTRCGNLFGPGDRNWERLIPGTVRSVLRGERPIVRSDGSLTRDYLFVVDAAQAYLRIVEAMATTPPVVGEAFNLSMGVQLSVLEVVDEIQRAAGTALELDVRATARHEIDHQALSSKKAEAILGWRPAHSLDEAMAETVAWYRDELG